MIRILLKDAKNIADLWKYNLVSRIQLVYEYTNEYQEYSWFLKIKLNTKNAVEYKKYSWMLKCRFSENVEKSWKMRYGWKYTHLQAENLAEKWLDFWNQNLWRSLI